MHRALQKKVNLQNLQSMASATDSNPPPFTFVLEYMASAMVIKSIRPMSYSIIRLCNIAALVLQKKESPVIHNFHPKAVLPWVGRVIDVDTDEMLNKIIRACISKGQYNLHLAVMFSDQPPYGGTDRHVFTRLLASRDEVTMGSEHTIVDAEGKAAKELAQPNSDGVHVKRRYRCSVCKADGHGKRTCKIVKPTPTMVPINKNIVVRVLNFCELIEWVMKINFIDPVNSL